MSEILTQAERHRLPWIHCEHTTVNREAVVRAHKQGIRVNVWTVDEAESLPLWREMEVDKICTNRPAVMLTAATKTG